MTLFDFFLNCKKKMYNVNVTCEDIDFFSNFYFNAVAT